MLLTLVDLASSLYSNVGLLGLHSSLNGKGGSRQTKASAAGSACPRDISIAKRHDHGVKAA